MVLHKSITAWFFHAVMVLHKSITAWFSKNSKIKENSWKRNYTFFNFLTSLFKFFRIYHSLVTKNVEQKADKVFFAFSRILKKWSTQFLSFFRLLETDWKLDWMCWLRFPYRLRFLHALIRTWNPVARLRFLWKATSWLIAWLWRL